MTVIPTKKQTCIECGFLGFDAQEVGSGDRMMLASRGTFVGMPRIDALGCRRSLWVNFDTCYWGNPDGPKLDEVNDPRQCKGFRTYTPGLSPDEHLRRLLESQDKRSQFRYTLLAVFAGAVLTLAGQWIAKFLGSNDGSGNGSSRTEMTNKTTRDAPVSKSR